MSKSKPLSELPNIGAKLERRLNEVGIHTKSDLRNVGPVEAHHRIQENYPDETLPVCYYLYAFEGALRGLHWDDIGDDRKKALKKAIGRDR